MSERIEIKDDGYSVVIKPKGKGQVRLFVNDTDSITQKTISAIRQQQADIVNLRAIMESQIETIDRIDRQRILAFDESEELRAELAAIKQEVSQAGYLGGPSLSACVNAMAGHLKDLQSELAAIKAAPVSAPRAEPQVEREPSEAIYPSESHAVPLADCRMCGASVDFVCRDGDWLARCSGCGLTLGEPHGYSSRLDLCRDWNRVVEREPSDDDYKQIYTLAKQFAFIDISDDTSYVVNGRAMWQAVREVMGGEVGR